MSTLASRRSLITGAAASLCAGPALAADRLGALEARAGGRIGVYALHVASGTRLAHRADERFPMCSTFKAMATAALLARVDAGAEQLDRFVRYGKADLFPYAPITSQHVGDGGMPLGELCAAAIEHSDNTAANLILGAVGGPASWTSFARRIGDPVSRLDRMEMALNTAIPGDPRDTTTPAAMAADLNLVLLAPNVIVLPAGPRHATSFNALNPVLTAASRERLTGWMANCQTGLGRLRHGFPAGWRVADKTGTGANNTANDIAVAWTPNGPIVAACYTTGTRVSGDTADALIAEVGRIIAGAFTVATVTGHG